MKIRRFFILPFTFLYILSTIGVPVYMHACHAQDKTWSSVYVPSKSCCAVKANSLSAPCHAASKASYPAFHKAPCCESHHGLVQLAGDYFVTPASWKDYPVFCATLSGTDDISGAFNLVVPAIIEYSSHGPPVKPPGREILIAFQRFLC